MMGHRTRYFHGVEIPSATTTQVHLCPDPSYEHVHLIGFDENGSPLCEIVVSKTIAEQIQGKLLK